MYLVNKVEYKIIFIVSIAFNRWFLFSSLYFNRQSIVRVAPVS